MKCEIVCATLICALSALPTFSTPTEKSAYAQVISYVENLLENFPITRGGGCFDKFIPLINSIADQAKVLSEVCASTADAKRHDLLRKERDELEGYVEKVKNSLTNCSSKSDNLGYFKCLKGIVDEDKQILDMIAKRSAILIKDYADKMQAIDKEEIICVEEIVREAQRESDEAFAYLKECVGNGQWPVTIVPTIVPTGSDLDRPSQRTDS